MSGLEPVAVATRLPEAGSAEDLLGLGDSTAPPPRRWWRRNTGVVVLAVVLVVLLGLLALAVRTDSGIPLDPRSPAPNGSRAVAQVLGDSGVEVRVVQRLDDLIAQAGPTTTVVLIDSGIALPDDRLQAIRGSSADLVLPSAGFLTLLALAPEVTQTGFVTGSSVLSRPVAAGSGCTDPDALAAGDITEGGDGYVLAGQDVTGGRTGSQRPVALCYPTGADPNPEAATFAVIGGDPAGPRVTLIGNTEILMNRELAAEGNAALALHTLGRQPTVLWYLADPLDPALVSDTADPVSPQSLLPRWVGWLQLQLVVAALVAIVWRFRRLGALIPERLPAIVRSVETAEGRARLYRRSGSRERAAALLRVEAARHLAARLGARRGATPTDVARLAASATGGDPLQLITLLAGPPPGTDSELVALADRLDALVSSVQRA